MIVGIGTDIVAIGRIQRILEKNPAFIRKVFAEGEIAYCEKRANKAESFAARFAAKEALMKATGLGVALEPADIRVHFDADGHIAAFESHPGWRVAEMPAPSGVALTVAWAGAVCAPAWVAPKADTATRAELTTRTKNRRECDTKGPF